MQCSECSSGGFFVVAFAAVVPRVAFAVGSVGNNEENRTISNGTWGAALLGPLSPASAVVRLAVEPLPALGCTSADTVEFQL